MKFFKLIRRNLFRNPLRAVLTMLLLGVIFFLVSTLMSILDSFSAYENAGEGANRLVVQSAISLANPLPFAYEQKLRNVPGVVDVSKMQWIGAFYKDRRNFFPNFAVDHENFERVFDDIKVPADQLAAWKNDRRGALVGKALVHKYHWKIGDRVALTHQIFPYDADLTVRGIYDHPINDNALYYHMDYHNESMHGYAQIGTYWLKVRDASQMAAISQQIDAMFRNSESPTETFTEKEFQASFMSMMGNIKLLFGAVCTCAILMVVMLAAITMSMSARERVTEIAVLKAIGFEKRQVLGLMLTEFVLLAIVGGALGSVGARMIFSVVSMADLSGGFIGHFSIHPQTIAICLGLAALTGLVAGGLPAMRAANLSVVNGLRRVV
jgi:putative ABC transport system permease protein